jgi:hypothetical protein
MTMERLRLSVDGIPWFLRYFPVASVGAVEQHGCTQPASMVDREWGDMAAPPEGVFQGMPRPSSAMTWPLAHQGLRMQVLTSDK